ncbi:efflux RND transporter periplasmic adaptor subunit [Pseudoalteromonas denitrificans]|uniref:RND family efflux transporter, MFP subunit n=1 Tax=Pseudoalteromonas denitrificans DSM 6059 TaxID=1123010 RepID=A0A1I1KNC3_9GAMM|nr:efflux RND transporter periplasmic adaptor subunit [Pseudoalteromonas denitrificans]SFC62065.1 RND family efflux transporter, MFP subunit [Pseudoalteromonas denitrificans DSM 6059]
MKKLLLSMLSAALITSTLAVSAEDQKAKLVTVDLAKNEQVNPTTWLPGNVISRTNSPISAEQTGQLLWIEDVGKKVKKGQEIATIDNRHLKLQLAQRHALLKQHEADVEYLTKQKKRMSKLNKMNNTALSELERIIKDLAIAQNEVLALASQIAQTQLAIDKTHITAPFSGSISQRFVNVGELISIGRPLVQLVDTYHLDIKIAAPMNIAPYLKQDAKVMVKWQEKLIELPVRTWSQAGSQISRTFDVHLSADGLNLLAGSAVTVSLPKDATKLATLVPRDALVLREKEIYILTVDENNQAKKVNVLVGQGIGQWVSISGDVNAGDEVIIRGGERLQAGQQIRRNKDLVAKVELN